MTMYVYALPYQNAESGKATEMTFYGIYVVYLSCVDVVMCRCVLVWCLMLKYFVFWIRSH